MSLRLAKIILPLWLCFTLMSVSIALFFSPMGLRLLLPEWHPLSWIYPALIVLPPIVVGTQKHLNTRASRLMMWSIAVPLAAFALLLLAFLGTALREIL